MTTPAGPSAARAFAATRAVLRERVVRGRLVGSVAGLLGVLLAAPMLVLPTHTIGIDPAQVQGGAPPFQQSFWSWGRVADTTPNAEAHFDVGNTVGVALLALALLAGLCGALAYAFRPGADGRVLGAAGLAWLAAEVVGTLGRRMGDTVAGMYGPSDTFRVDALPAGVLQVAAAVLLLIALGAVVRRPVLGLVRPAFVRARALVRRVLSRGAATVEPASGEPSAPQVGIATIRDVGTGDPVARGATVRAERAGTGVGFSDNPGSDPDRFRPPP